MKLHHRSHRSLWILLFLPLCFLSPAIGQISEEVSVDLIEIWVKVVDQQGKPVSDLEPDDFSVYIDGKKMKTLCFDRVSSTEFLQNVSAEPAEAESESSIQKRKFLLYFDLLNSTPGDIDVLKREMMDFLNRSFDDDDQGMIFALLPNLKLGIVQQMTSNKAELINVIAKMRGNPTLKKRVLNNERALLDLIYAAPAIRNLNVETTRQARYLARSFAMEEQTLSKMTLDSFVTVANHLSGSRYDGRLVLIYVSGGFPIRPGQNYHDIVDRAIESNALVGSEDVIMKDLPYEDLEREIADTIGILNRLNVTIYSIDASGVLENQGDVERDSRLVEFGHNRLTHLKELQDSLSIIARETGGLAFLNSQNYEKGLSEIVTDMNEQYWLCSNLPRSEKSGKYHKIEVKVDRPGLKVRHRKGYVG